MTADWFTAERDAIYKQFLDNWSALQPLVKVAYENKSFTPPPNAAWVRLQIVPGDGRQISFGTDGNNLHRSAGVIIVQIFVQLDKGELFARQIANSVLAIFGAKQIGSGIICLTPKLTNVGAGDAYFQMNVSVPYQRDSYL